MKLCYVLLMCVCITYLSFGSDNNRTLEGKYLFTNQVKTSPFKSATDNLLESKKKIVSEFTLSREYAKYTFTQNSGKIVINNFPINTVEYSTVTLEKLTPIIDANTLCYAVTKDGTKRIPGITIQSYKGTIESNPNAKVFLTYINGNLTGTIDYCDGNKYDITTSTDADENSNINPKVIISDYNLNKQLNPESEILSCKTDESMWDMASAKEDKERIQNEILSQTSDLLEVKITIEGDYSYYVLKGSNETKALAYIAQVIAQVSYIYEEYINTRITLNSIVLHEDQASDPYYSNNKLLLEDMLYYMPTVWKNNIPSGSALVCLFSSLPNQAKIGSGYYTAGISYGGSVGYGSLCSSNWGYCCIGITGQSTYPNYNYTWDVSCAAHEMGHNFGNPHTHNCYYLNDGSGLGLIDTCITSQLTGAATDACLSIAPIPTKGTIMSYCHLLSSSGGSVELKFHWRQVQGMRAAVERSSSCASAPANPTIAILDPLVNNILYSGKNYPIRWTSSKVSYVKITYSIDNGANWNVITNSVPALDSVFVWTIPYSNTTTGLMIIADADNPETIADTTKVKFSIVSPSIKVTSPSTILSFGHSEKLNINWTAANCKYTKVQLSTDNGNSWNTLTGYDSTKLTNIKWTIPESITSDFCIIKVICADEGYSSIYSVSPVFKIGASTFKFTSPSSGENLCKNTKSIISWDSKYVAYFYCYYSIDSGKTWIKAYISYLPAEPNHYFSNWTVPNIAGDHVLLKAILKDDTSKVLCITDYTFKIDSCTTGVSENIETNSNFVIKSIVPNPVKNIATINYECIDNGINTFEFYISDVNGNIVQNPNKIIAECGSNSIQCDLGHLPTGSYMLYVNIKGNIISYPFVIEK